MLYLRGKAGKALSLNMESILDGVAFNDAQLQAVKTVNGPLLILAGAGSGKTRVLTYRIAHMVRDLGIPSHSILAITFTNKAANEMRSRISNILGSTRGMWILTFHSLCARMLRTDAEKLGYSSSFTIYGDDDSKRLVKEIYRELDINEKNFPIQQVRYRISKAKNNLQDCEAFASRASNHGVEDVAARVYQVLSERLARANAMDFDDLLMHGYRLLKSNPDILDAYRERFRYISVDEYQDTNHAQYEIARLLAGRFRNLMVVGDDDQSIYSWRGADIRNILEFEKDYPDAKVVKLEENYRSTSTILNAANAVIENNSKRKSKTLYTSGDAGDPIDLYLAADERDEGRWIASEIEKRITQGYSYSDIAVFYRTNAQSRMLEDMLMRAGVPYQIVGGTRFFDRAEIRDVMAYLSVVVNPADDISAKRIVNMPRRGIGDNTVAFIEDKAAKEGLSFMEALQASIVDESLSSRARTGLARFDSLIRTVRSYTGSMRDVVEMIVSQSGLLEYFESRPTIEDRARAENIREFFGVVSEFEDTHSLFEEEDSAPTVEAGITKPLVVDKPKQASEMDMIAMALAAVDETAGFDGTNEGAAGGSTEGTTEGTAVHMLSPLMEWLSLRSDLDSLNDSDSAVTLMTVHSAKGLEFPVVFLAGMEEGIFPHQSSMGSNLSVEEERRLAYVAITRAKEHLSICCTQQRSLFGDTRTNPMSRFVEEIPSTYIRQAGVGSLGYSGTGFEKRGSRRGIYGSGTSYEQSDGHVFGSRNPRSSRRRFSSTRDSAFASKRFSRASQLEQLEQLDGSKNGGKRSTNEASVKFAVGDKVDHKVFGRGRVIDVDKDILQIHFENGGTKKLLVGYAPIVKIE